MALWVMTIVKAFMDANVGTRHSTWLHVQEDAEEQNLFCDESYRATEAVQSKEALAILQFADSANLSEEKCDKLLDIIRQVRCMAV
jgi:hypothetical protein